jgi:hypothetical protein
MPDQSQRTGTMLLGDEGGAVFPKVTKPPYAAKLAQW